MNGVYATQKGGTKPLRMLGFLFGTTQILSLGDWFSLSKNTSGNSHVSIKDVELDSIIVALYPSKVHMTV